MTKIIDLAKAMIRGDVPQPPVGRLIGFYLVSLEPGSAVIEFQATKNHTNPMGTLHGGVLCDIADGAMGMAYASNLNDGESFTLSNSRSISSSQSGMLVFAPQDAWSNKVVRLAWSNAT